MNINTKNIPEVTAELFERFAGLVFMQKFTLVGGTALALQLGHRQSEDLDFIFDGEKITVKEPTGEWRASQINYCKKDTDKN